MSEAVEHESGKETEENRHLDGLNQDSPTRRTLRDPEATRGLLAAFAAVRNTGLEKATEEKSMAANPVKLVQSIKLGSRKKFIIFVGIVLAIIVIILTFGHLVSPTIPEPPSNTTNH